MREWKDDLVTPLRVYSIRDDAIDPMASDVDEYLKTRNPDLIHALPGQHLVAAVIKPLPVAVYAQVDTLSTVQAKLLQAFRIACTAVETAPGATLMPMEAVRLSDGKPHTIWGNEEFEELGRMYGIQFIYEIGTVIMERAEPGKAWRGGVRYTPPPFLEDARARISLRRAAQMSASAGTDSSGESSSESPT